ncbi:MAG: hypothetical protein NXI04_29550 [Planctomycetaceae bacterium]|nr:hypothetical protein [Planctomycetaceae bacterium]
MTLLTDEKTLTFSSIPTQEQLEAAIPPRPTQAAASGQPLRKKWSATMIVLGITLLAAGFAAGMMLGRQQATTVEVDDEVRLRQLAIEHLVQESDEPDRSHFAIETFDHRDNVVAITGIERSNDDTFRVGRFWVELRRENDQWEPLIVQRRTAQGNAMRNAFDWP